MATKISAIALILSLLFFATFDTTFAGCKPKPKLPPKGPPANPFCPRDTLKLGACANLLGGVLNPIVGTAPSSKCCTVLAGLADAEAAVCLCTAIKANVLGINLNVPVALSLLINTCGKSIPPGFKCV
ncbi:hypothetical protein HHK36_021397 [Tetracentron sinense]|uniref:Bifunctional inhibitor/plant lipid transfer protein/seed storage helical domain-containing protein n=1 Tax=Tetracentron sinense TaxID=13715 RepID=A0A834YWW9_TETSI|nr:hypothetical protein HHK36_021397 [Tetracentron sinense]